MDQPSMLPGQSRPRWSLYLEPPSCGAPPTMTTRHPPSRIQSEGGLCGYPLDSAAFSSLTPGLPEHNRFILDTYL